MKQENPIVGTKKSIVTFYRRQLRKFNKIGLGKETENRVLITKDLINITQTRLSQLSVSYEASLSVEGKHSRKRQRELSKAILKIPLKKDS